MPDEDEPPPRLSPEERARLFDMPAPRAAPPPPVRPPIPDAPLELDRPEAKPVEVIERIRIGGVATVVRVFVLSAGLAFVLFEALRWVYRH